MKDDIVPQLQRISGLLYPMEMGGVIEHGADEIRDLRKEVSRWKAIAERIHELALTDHVMSGDITEVIMDIENDWAELQYHVDVCRDSGLIPSRVPFRRLGE